MRNERLDQLFGIRNINNADGEYIAFKNPESDGQLYWLLSTRVYDILTESQVEILIVILSGITKASDIADLLHVSKYTVSNQITGANSRGATRSELGIFGNLAKETNVRVPKNGLAGLLVQMDLLKSQ